ncbi:MAG: hypothetical protein IPI11_10480 [Haliscomenobacter sp.]|nr:hypothetical protein [Haliscomenobacter sp.]
MKGNLNDPKRGNEPGPKWKEMVNPIEGLVVLANRIDWDFFEKEFSPSGLGSEFLRID